MKKISRLLMVSVFISALSGCASMMYDSDQEIIVNTYPDNAKIEVFNKDNKHIQTLYSPAIMRLSRSNGYFSGGDYQLQISKEGYREHKESIHSYVSKWYLLGNFLFGGPLGWLFVDPLTGSMYGLTPNELNVSLKKNEMETK